jgi:uncharacterized protein (DUF1684 family)
MVRRALVLIALSTLAVSACAPQSQVEDYVGKIEALRASKDDSFKNDPESPIPADKKSILLPLAYYPIDELYAVPATLEPSADRTRIQVPTSIGKIRDLEVVGTLKFTVKGQTTQLTAFMEITEPRSNRLFVPFADQTSGKETYPAGRYMELDPTPTGIYLVDFNIAYHPYCYYSPEYDCPFPPKENRLQMPIRAGEKMSKADTSAP